VKGVGDLIALTYVLTIDDPRRFRKSREQAVLWGCSLGGGTVEWRFDLAASGRCNLTPSDFQKFSRAEGSKGLKREHPTCTERKSFYCECGWNGGDRGSLAEAGEKKNSRKEQKLLTPIGLLMEGPIAASLWGTVPQSTTNLTE
jgi:hypothetical protein